MPPKKNSEKKIQPQEEPPLTAGMQALNVANKFVLYGGLALFLFSLFFVDISTFAAAPNLMTELSSAGGEAGIGPQSIGIIVANIIQTVLGLLGVVFVVLIIYSGFLWMSASGNDEKIKLAQGHLRNAIIGVCIVVGAQIITYWVLYSVTQAAIDGMPEPPPPPAVAEPLVPHPPATEEKKESIAPPVTDPAADAAAAAAKAAADAKEEAANFTRKANASECDEEGSTALHLTTINSGIQTDCSKKCQDSGYKKGSGKELSGTTVLCCCQK